MTTSSSIVATVLGWLGGFFSGRVSDGSPEATTRRLQKENSKLQKRVLKLEEKNALLWLWLREEHTENERHQGRFLEQACTMERLSELSTTDAVIEYAIRVDALKTVQRQEVEKLHEELGRDDLTGLLRQNTLRRAFHRHAHEVGRTVARIREETGNQNISWPETSILFMDVDNFKGVNDSYGHPIGDEVLTHIAQAIKGAIREDDIPARFGGDEFVIVLSNASTKEAETTAERIRRSVEAHDFSIKGLSVTVSIGIARVHMDRFPDNPNMAIEEARTRSDMAMYEAKKAGRNRIVVAKDSVSLQ